MILKSTKIITQPLGAGDAFRYAPSAPDPYVGPLMTKVAWLLVATLLLGSASGIVPATIGWIGTPFAILLAIFLLAIAERRRLKACLSPGEKVTMPKSQKIVLAIFGALVLALVFIGSLTKQ